MSDVAEMLLLDGYTMTISTESTGVGVDIAAGPDACEECLVSKELMEEIIRDALGKGNPAWRGCQIAVSYPTDV